MADFGADGCCKLCLLDVCVHATCFFTSRTLKLLASGQKLNFWLKNSMNLALFLIRTPPPCQVPQGSLPSSRSTAFLHPSAILTMHWTVCNCQQRFAVVLCSAPRPFVAVFSVKSHQECPCIRAKCTDKRYMSSRQCYIEASNMVQCVFHHGAITLRCPLIVLLVHTTPYAS